MNVVLFFGDILDPSEKENILFKTNHRVSPTSLTSKTALPLELTDYLLFPTVYFWGRISIGRWGWFCHWSRRRATNIHSGGSCRNLTCPKEHYLFELGGTVPICECWDQRSTYLSCIWLYLRCTLRIRSFDFQRWQRSGSQLWEDRYWVKSLSRLYLGWSSSRLYWCWLWGRTILQKDR